MIKTVVLDVGGTVMGAPDMFSEIGKYFPDCLDKNEVIADTSKAFNSLYIQQRNDETEFMSVEEMICSTLKEISYKFKVTDISDKAKEIYSNIFIDQSFLFPDTLGLLDELHQKNIKMIIASDADSELIYKQFKLHNISYYFHKYCISSEIKAYKPTQIFLNALRNLVGTNSLETIIVGDSEVDIQTGKRMGIKTVLINRNNQMNIISDYKISKLSEVMGIINELSNAESNRDTLL